MIDQPQKTPQESADELSGALEHNTSALNRVRRRYWVNSFLVAAILIISGIVVKLDYDGRVDQCIGVNSVRSELDDKFQSVGDYLRSLDVDSPETDQLADIISEDLQRRDCSDIAWIGR